MAMNKAEKQVANKSLRDELIVMRETKKNYQMALDDVNVKIKELMDRMEGADPVVIHQLQYQQAIRDQIQSTLDGLNSKNYETVRKYLSTEYENGFLGSIYSMQKQGIPLAMPIDQKAAVAMIETGADGIKLSERLYKQTRTLKKQVRQQVSIGMASGESYQDIAARMERTMNVDYTKTFRIARTEGGRVQQSARYEAMQNAKKSGADIVKQWDSTLDGRTRPDHIWLDGQIQELDDPFTVGNMKARYPHDFGRPDQDINCRCTMLQRARWAVDDTFGKTFKEYTKWDANKPPLFSDDDKFISCYADLSDSKNFRDFKKRHESALKKAMKETAKKAAKAAPAAPTVTVPANIPTPELRVESFPEFTRATKANASKMQKFAESVNQAKDRDPVMSAIYDKMDELSKRITAPQEVKFSQDGHAITYWHRSAGPGEMPDITKVQAKLPMMSGKYDGMAGEASSMAHELGHYIDMARKNGKAGFASAHKDSPLTDLLKTTRDKKGLRILGEDDLSDKALQVVADNHTARKAVQKKALEDFDEVTKALKKKYPEELRKTDYAAYSAYQKEFKKALGEYKKQVSLGERAALNGADDFEDILDALSGGFLRDRGVVSYGHGSRYFGTTEAKAKEIWANYCSLSIYRPDLVELLREDYPELVKVLDELRDDMAKELGIDPKQFDKPKAAKKS